MVTNFDIERYRQGLRSSVFVNAPPGLLFPGDPEFAQKNNGSAENPKSDVRIASISGMAAVISVLVGPSLNLSTFAAAHFCDSTG